MANRLIGLSCLLRPRERSECSLRKLGSFQLAAAVAELGDEAGFGGEDPDEEEEEAGGGGHHAGGVGVAEAKEGGHGDRSDVTEQGKRAQRRSRREEGRA